MSIRKEIIDLIQAEQIRQDGTFVPEGGDYLEKLANKAELLSHDFQGSCLGFVFFYCNDPRKESSYITLLMVEPNSRINGLATTLVRYVLTLTQQRGFKVCRLEVRKTNIEAIKFYESMGFHFIEDRGEKYLMEAPAS